MFIDNFHGLLFLEVVISLGKTKVLLNRPGVYKTHL